MPGAFISIHPLKLHIYAGISNQVARYTFLSLFINEKDISFNLLTITFLDTGPSFNQILATMYYQRPALVLMAP
jgi:hypothetical protein